MHKIFIVGYFGKLVLGLLPFLYELFLIWLKKVKVLWLSSAILLIVLSSLVLTFFSASLTAESYTLHPQQHAGLNERVVADVSILLTKNQAEKLLQEYQAILELQPTHQDSAVNAALLSSYLNKPALSQSYWELALSIDPNLLEK